LWRGGGAIVTDRILELRDEVVRLCVESNQEVVVLLGDFFDRKTADGVELAVGVDLLYCLAEKGMQVLVVPGNHCALRQDGTLYLVDGLDGLSNKVRVVHEGEVSIDGRTFLCMSYRSDDLARTLLKQKAGVGTNLLMHQSVRGAKVGSWASPVGLQGEDLSHLGIVLSGHFHTSQWWARGQGYVGAPIQHSFEDHGDDRGAWYGTGSGSDLGLTFLPSKGRRFWVQRVDSEAEARAAAGAVPSRDFIKLIFRGTPTELARTLRWRQEWASVEGEATGKTIVWDEEVIESEREADSLLLSSQENNRHETQHLRDENLVASYIASCDVTGENTSRLKAAGLEALQSAERN
jgi:DNA repair exonuclease SbcCD nuclease subunit